MSWSDDAIRKLDKSAPRKQERDATFLERQRLKQVHGLPLWREIRKLLKDECADFNEKAVGQSLTFEVTVEREISVLANLDGEYRYLKAHFVEDTGTIHWVSGLESDDWKLNVTPNGDVQFFWGSNPATPETIKNRMLQALVFGKHL